MVKIIDNATFNRSTLLGELADDAYALSNPGDDYIKATHLVWNAMRNQALEKDSDSMTGNKGREGFNLVGMGPVQALHLIWPGMDKLELARVRTAVVAHLKNSDNAMCIKQGRGWSLSEWWVAEEWQEIKLGRGAVAKARPRKPKPVDKVEPPVVEPTPQVEPSPVAEQVEPSPVAEQVEPWRVVPEVVTVDDLEKAFATIRNAFSVLANMQDENKQLRDRLDRITDVIKGE